ncbi:hypothetical protein [Thioalkalivibrio sp. ALgr3]|uniref:hypothetical protein n=1 Tax=Thioalkalivibrio sp. ALgr3 TaxID=1239292 RepID=UPI00037338A6|nr:hypothetical protein [Thioalkalivibrio sp. ALgr3]
MQDFNGTQEDFRRQNYSLRIDPDPETELVIDREGFRNCPLESEKSSGALVLRGYRAETDSPMRNYLQAEAREDAQGGPPALMRFAIRRFYLDKPDPSNPLLQQIKFTE